MRDVEIAFRFIAVLHRQKFVPGYRGAVVAKVPYVLVGTGQSRDMGRSRYLHTVSATSLHRFLNSECSVQLWHCYSDIMVHAIGRGVKAMSHCKSLSSHIRWKHINMGRRKSPNVGTVVCAWENIDGWREALIARLPPVAKCPKMVAGCIARDKGDAATIDAKTEIGIVGAGAARWVGTWAALVLAL